MTWHDSFSVCLKTLELYICGADADISRIISSTNQATTHRTRRFRTYCKRVSQCCLRSCWKLPRSLVSECQLHDYKGTTKYELFFFKETFNDFIVWIEQCQIACFIYFPERNIRYQFYYIINQLHLFSSWPDWDGQASRAELLWLYAPLHWVKALS